MINMATYNFNFKNCIGFNIGTAETSRKRKVEAEGICYDPKSYPLMIVTSQSDFFSFLQEMGRMICVFQGKRNY